MRNERAGHTLQTSAPINEAYMRLIDIPAGALAELRSFLRHCRATDVTCSGRLCPQPRYKKRGGGALQVSLDE